MFEYQWLIEHINNKDFIMWTNWIMKLENFINQYSSISDNHKSFIDTLITNHQNYKMIEDVMINHFSISLSNNWDNSCSVCLS